MPWGCAILSSCAAHTRRQVKVTVPGPFTMAQQAQIDYYGGSREQAAMDYAAAVNEEIRDLFSCRGGRGADRRALHAGAPGRGARLRAAGAQPRARKRLWRHRRAHLLRLRRHHSRAPVRLLVPAGARRVQLRAGVDRDRAVEPRLRGAHRGCRAKRSSSASSTSPTTRSRRRSWWRAASAARCHSSIQGDLLVAPDCGMKYLPRDVAFGKLRPWWPARSWCAASSKPQRAA